MSTRVLTAHVPVDLAEKVDELAAHMERSRGWIVKEALRDWVALAERRHQMILEALEEVDAGLAIDHADVEAWVVRLENGETKA